MGGVGRECVEFGRWVDASKRGLFGIVRMFFSCFSIYLEADEAEVKGVDERPVQDPVQHRGEEPGFLVCIGYNT